MTIASDCGTALIALPTSPVRALIGITVLGPKLPQPDVQLPAATYSVGAAGFAATREEASAAGDSVPKIVTGRAVAIPPRVSQRRIMRETSTDGIAPDGSWRR